VCSRWICLEPARSACRRKRQREDARNRELGADAELMLTRLSEVSRPSLALRNRLFVTTQSRSLVEETRMISLTYRFDLGARGSSDDRADLDNLRFRFANRESLKGRQLNPAVANRLSQAAIRALIPFLFSLSLSLFLFLGHVLRSPRASLSDRADDGKASVIPQIPLKIDQRLSCRLGPQFSRMLQARSVSTTSRLNRRIGDSLSQRAAELMSYFRVTRLVCESFWPRVDSVTKRR